MIRKWFAKRVYFTRGQFVGGFMIYLCTMMPGPGLSGVLLIVGLTVSVLG